MGSKGLMLHVRLWAEYLSLEKETDTIFNANTYRPFF